MIITIDGPAGSGKSTVADIIADQLGFIHFNSGALFRGVTAYLHEQNFKIESIKINSTIPDFNLQVKIIDNDQHVFVNDTDYTAVLRNNTISTLVPFVAINKNVRKRIDECQRNFCLSNNIVIEGRDIGSFVFPDADVKFYLDCSIKERARRRFLEEKSKNSQITIEEIEQQIAKRDHLDKTREIAPLVVPDNAIVVDSSEMSVDEVVSVMLNHIQSKQL